MKASKRYLILVRSSGDFIADYDTPEEAKKDLAEIEQADKQMCMYIKDYYEIYDFYEDKTII